MRKVKFIVDFANKVAGDIGTYDSMLANQLVEIDKVAEYYTESKEKTKK